MSLYFISDLHLSEDTPLLTEQFLNSLQSWAGQIEALYILGDLFEYWVGDDDTHPYILHVLQAMKAFAKQTPLFVMVGNRDFLMKEGFEQTSGAHLLPDPYVLNYQDQTYLLSHGDQYCTDDLSYMQFRQISRQSAWQNMMLSKSLIERHAIARATRAQSQQYKQEQGVNPISDVTLTAITQAITDHPCTAMIHGHTHRPGNYAIGSLTPRRYVLPDWTETQMGGLILESGQLRNFSLLDTRTHSED